MSSKDETEDRILQIFYSTGLDKVHRKYPTQTEIVQFEKTESHDEVDHWYSVKGETLQVAIWANSCDHALPFIAANMAFDSANKGQLTPPFLKIILIYMAAPIAYFGIIFYFRTLSFFLGILTALVGFALFGYLIYNFLTGRRKKTAKMKELFDETQITLIKDDYEKYSRQLLKDDLLVNVIFQVFAGIILLMGMAFVLSFDQVARG